MDSEDFAFDVRVKLDGSDISSFSDVERLLDTSEIESHETYGFESFKEMADYIINEIYGVEEDLADFTEIKWIEFARRYDEAGGVIYNPENTDEYYTDKTSLSAEDVE